VGVIIGMDPHKRPATIEVIDEQAAVLAAGRYGTDKAGYAQMLATARTFADRVWAVEGCNGIGRHLAHRLVHDGEIVSGVPPKLSAQVRVFATGNGRKTDPVDAHSVALAALRAPGLVQVRPEEDLVVMGMLADRRDELGRARTQVTGRLHRLLPGTAARRGQEVPVRPAGPDADRHRQATGPGRQGPPPARRGADRRTRGHRQQGPALDKELAGLVTARGSTLMDLHGIGPSGAARLLADAGDTPPVRQPRPVRLPGTAPPRWTHPPAARPATACPGPETGASTVSCTSWRSCGCGTRPRAGPATTHGELAACRP
jgi:transposase